MMLQTGLFKLFHLIPDRGGIAHKGILETGATPAKISKILDLSSIPHRIGSFSGVPSREHHGVGRVEILMQLTFNMEAVALKLQGDQVDKNTMRTETMVRGC